jgi:hypothetical protein
VGGGTLNPKKKGREGREDLISFLGPSTVSPGPYQSPGSLYTISQTALSKLKIIILAFLYHFADRSQTPPSRPCAVGR